MIEFVSVTMKNFLSFGAVPVTVPLNKTGTTIILGEDLDDTANGVGANGVGKTVLLNALTYGCYDKAISEIQKDNLVNNINKKKMMVSVVFIADGVNYTINRFRKMKAGASGNYVQLLQDGKNITPSSLGETNKLIENIIGMPYEIFVRVVTFSANLRPFLDLPVHSTHGANQTDIVEELVDLKVLSEKAVNLKEIIKDTKLSLKTQMVDVDHQQTLKDRHDKQIGTAKTRVLAWEEDNKRKITNLKAKLLRVEQVDIDEQRQLSDRAGELKTMLATIKTTIRELMVKKKATDGKVKDLSDEIHHLSDDKCPYCLQKYIDADKKVTQCEADKATLISDVSKITKKVKAADKKSTKIGEEYDVTLEKLTVSDIDELLEIKNKQSVYQDQVKDLQTALNPHLESLDELEATKFDKINMDKINELTSLIEHQQFLLKLLTKKDSFVRKTLLNKSIPFLNARLMHYLKELGLPHVMEFTHEMTASISQFGRAMDFGNLSSGQRARVNLALSFAFRDVLQNRTSRINVCLLDEVLDVGLDAVGITKAAQMLKHKARTEKISIYIISHRDEINSTFDNKLTVQLEKGFSSIIGLDDD